MTEGVLHRLALVAGVPLLLAGCATLPASGPTVRQVLRADDEPNRLGIAIMPITAATLRGGNGDGDWSGGAIGEPSSSYIGQGDLKALPPAQRTDLIGVGDVLQVNIFEVGVTLFGGGSAQLGSETFDPTARGERLTGIVVDEGGAIRLPYVGTVPAAGRTAEAVAATVQARMRGLSQQPQATVSIVRSAQNRVVVSGDVRQPGIQPLTAARERLLDAIAEAGGAQGDRSDTVVRVQRGDQTAEIRLDTVVIGSASDVLLSPGDRVEVIDRPRSFTVFGASTRPGRIAFEAPELTLAEALAKAGGLNDQLADPKGVFLFRFVADPTVAEGERPVVYRLDLMNPASYFLAQRFVIDDKDVLYVANAAANQPSKLVGIINQLFSPFVTARAVTR